MKEFITDEFKTAVQAVLDQALRGEETANFGKIAMLQPTSFYWTVLTPHAFLNPPLAIP